MGYHIVNDAPRIYVLDTGPLSHFARSQWLGVLKAVLGDVQAVIPDVVADELQNGSAENIYLRPVLDADWIQTIPIETQEQLNAFAYYERRLVGPDRRNVGECGVLALAETMAHAVAVIDDRVAGNAVRGRSGRGTPHSRTAVRRDS